MEIQQENELREALRRILPVVHPKSLFIETCEGVCCKPNRKALALVKAFAGSGPVRVMPAKPWYVRLFRFIIPQEGISASTEGTLCSVVLTASRSGNWSVR